MPTTYAIPNGRTVMNVLTWSGTGGSASATRSLTGLGFKPDFVWEKNRSSGQDHHLFDSVRGAGTSKTLASNSADPEGGFNDTLYGYLSSFDVDGFTTTNGSSTWDNWNKSGDTYVGWSWQAGQGTTSSNTSGSITSTVSVNATAGFSIVTYTGTGSNATVGHGLGAAPGLIICKNRDVARGWAVYHTSLGNTKNILLNSTGGSNTSSTYWNNTSPTSAVFSVGSDEGANESTKRIVAYCWAAVPGFSAFGTYTGNNNADGPFVYLGFRPRFIMIKRTDTTGYNWDMRDTSRDPYNADVNILGANSSLREADFGTIYYDDILSNGFKIRHSDGSENASGGTYIYAAFAENPFKYANAR